MGLEKIIIQNFKCYKDLTTIKFNKKLNIFVGNNDSGKSTILEAIHLALTGIYNGKNIQQEISQYLFNSQSVNEYLQNINMGKQDVELPQIIIELYFDEEESALFEGNYNLEKLNKCRGIRFEISYNEEFNEEYKLLINNKNINSLPIEYYNVIWKTFARESITVKSIPVKSSMIDSSSFRYYNGSDIYVSRIVKNMLSLEEVTSVIQAHRRMRESFMSDEVIKKINEKIENNGTKLTSGTLSINVNLGNKNSWEESITTYLNDIPFNYIGKGAQCILKTELALGHKKAEKSEVLLFEEPESHLSYSKLNELLSSITNNYSDKQVFISSHSSFLANKLGLNNLILVYQKKIKRFENLSCESYFKKLAGYDTLRLVLCKKAILVEGDSDELIIQKAYLMENGKLPIQDGIDVISVGTSFLRFLEIAKFLDIKVSVVTDNDGDIAALEKKYANYLSKKYANIKICYSTELISGDLENFNYNTLEPNLRKANNDDMDLFNKILGTNFSELSKLDKYMKNHKTECALKIFEFDFCGEKISFNFPQYILEAIRNEQ